jgi:hypothetical protein
MLLLQMSLNNSKSAQNLEEIVLTAVELPLSTFECCTSQKGSEATAKSKIHNVRKPSNKWVAIALISELINPNNDQAELRSNKNNSCIEMQPNSLLNF